ncbi:restriction endonuclease subunit S [Litchfieldia salsa]|uniref:Type I restriction enzyme, S subunit n=1 Tax=Litchfieldia salsa TaxID=930152 RepID=A0A1H0PMK0_9BACI|nr:restriction endonuclease subunit S [Litchfieldia salsa]SDP06337.1 type I restriction enzyme, S subunit [Litchfieldia salsa]
MVKKDNTLLRFMRFSNLNNWSVNFSTAIKNAFTSAESIKIGKLLTRSKDIVEIKDGVQYRRVTIRLYNKGVLLRDKEYGKNIGTKKQYKIKAGQFIVSKIDARNGAFGIVPKELEGAIITSDFLAFDVNLELVNPQYLLRLLSSESYKKLWQSLSSGATGRQRIQEEKFLNLLIYLPSLEVQNRLILSHHIMMVKSREKSNEADLVPDKVELMIYSKLGIEKNIKVKEKKSFLQLINFKSLQLWGVDKNIGFLQYKYNYYTPVSFMQNTGLFIDIFRGKSPKYDPKSSKVVLNQKCNRINDIELEHAKPVNETWLASIDNDRLTKEGDIIINSTGEGTIGRASLITKGFDGYLIDSHMLLLRVNKEKINPLFLVYQFNSSYVQDQIDFLKSAQATKQTELGLDNLKKIQFVLPELDKQKSVSREIQKEFNKAKALYKEAEDLKNSANDDFERSVFGEN